MSNKNWRSLAACGDGVVPSDAEELVKLGLLEKRQQSNHQGMFVYRRTLTGRAEIAGLRPPRALERRWRGGA
jgi:hypothetical protein